MEISLENLYVDIGALRVKGVLLHLSPGTMPCWWFQMRTKQLSMAATARVIWMCACGRYWPYSWYMCFSAKIGIAGNSPALHPLPTHLPFAPSPLNCPSPSCHPPALHPLPAHLPFTPLPPTCPSPSSYPTALHSLATHLPFVPSPLNCPSPLRIPAALHSLSTHASYTPCWRCR